MPSPQRPIPFAARVVLAFVCLLVASHCLVWYLPGLVLGHGYWNRLSDTWLGTYARRVALVELWVLRHPWAFGVAALAALYGSFRLYLHRKRAKNARFTEAMTGLRDDLADLRFPTHSFDPVPHILSKKRNGWTFVGLTPERRVFPPMGNSWTPVYLSPEERSMHRHVLGKTGTGKTAGILWPQVLQDALDGKGVLVVDAKGSDENAQMMQNIAALVGREQDFRCFALPAWNKSEVFSHAYNLVHVAAKTKTSGGGDVTAMAERVFAAFEKGDSHYYNTQAQLAFGAVCRLLYGLGTHSGVPLGGPFNLEDVGICITGLSNPSTGSGKALKWCLANSKDRTAADQLRAQVQSLGKDLGVCLSGLTGAIATFSSPLVNAYQPDIVFEEVLQRNLLVYVQLPSNYFKLQAPALGRMMLMDLQQEASLRQVFRKTRNQRAFSVNIDEFGSFADLSVIDSLNKLRDAHIEFTLSHQSLADVELVSKEFAQAVWDNTRTKDVLAQDNPELCERMARSLGTKPRLEHTLQQAPDGFADIAATGAMSTRAVEAYRLHPNRLKYLASRGQGFLFASRPEGRVAIPVVYGKMPELPAATGELKRIDQSRAPGLRLHKRFVEGQSTPVEIGEAPPAKGASDGAQPAPVRHGRLPTASAPRLLNLTREPRPQRARVRAPSPDSDVTNDG